MSTSSSSTNQPVDKRKYHTASAFYLFCKQFIDENTSRGRRFRTEKQGIESAALKWNTFPIDEHLMWQRIFREQRKQSNEDEKRKYKIRNGSRRDGEYDPWNLGKIKDLSLKDKDDSAALDQRWSWLYSGDIIGVAAERFLIIGVDISSTEKHPGAFKNLAVVEFSLSNGILEEFHADVEGCLDGSVKARMAAISRVLHWPLKYGRSLNEATPAFYVVPGQLESVYNALTYVDDTKKICSDWDDLESKFSLSHDLANVQVLFSALAKYFGRTPVVAGTSEEGGCLELARKTVQNILADFGF